MLFKKNNCCLEVNVMKKTDSLLKDYVSKLSFDSLRFLADRFTQRIGSDLSEAIDFCSNNTEVDKLLSAAKNYEEFWVVVDSIAFAVEKELNKRVPDLVSHG
jgi:hypothetical protein